MKSITKQLIIAALILALVTVASLGIRQVRFSLHRANTLESPVFADPESNPTPADSHTVDAEPDPQYAYASDLDIEDEPEPQYATASDSVKGTPSKAKSFKGDKAKSKGSKGLEKMSLGDSENLYRTAEGQLWYVSKQPDGKTVKMQVQIDDATGEITIVDAKSGGSQNLQKISLGDNENLYITEEGQQWYVSEQPDGSSSKSRVLIDDTTGEVTVLEDYSGDGQEGAGKD
ncbi:hypothetical protein ACFL5Z_07870 [Planctomycetota bacterium]